MKARETLDEAIDRVATQMTRGDESLHVDIRPAFAHALRRGKPAFAHALRRGRPAFAHALPPTRTALRRTGRRGRPVAILVGVAAVLIAAVIVTIRTPWVDQRVGESSIGVSPVVAWSPLRAPVSDARTQRVEERVGVARNLRARPAVEVERPAWGIPFIDAPAALDVAASTTPAIAIETVGVEAIDVEPLTIDAIDRDSATSPKEQ